MTRSQDEIMEIFKEECSLKSCFEDTMKTIKICGVEIPMCERHEHIRNRCFYEEKTKQ